MIFYEAPHKLLATLKDFSAVFGEERPITLCRELTKLHEEYLRCTIGEALAYYGDKTPKGEFVLVVAGAKDGPNDSISLSLKEHMARCMADGLSEKEAMKKVAEERGMRKSDVYAAYKLGKDVEG